MIYSTTIYAHYLYGCSILGGILIVAGLYSVLWGKYKEYKEAEVEKKPEAVEGNEERNETNDIEMQRNQAVAVSFPSSQPPMIGREAPRA